MRLRVLLAESDEEQTLALSRALESLGRQVLAQAGEGREACRLCRELEPGLVLMALACRVLTVLRRPG